MPLFFNIKVSSIDKNTKDAVTLTLEIPSELKNDFIFHSGQYLTLEKKIGNNLIRRSYSICSSPNENILQVAVKKIKGGIFSNYINEKIKPGDSLNISMPEGRFLYKKGGVGVSIIAFAAGSGITPVISILKTVLEENKLNKFHLIYGNKTPEKTMFYDSINALKNKYENQLTVNFIFSQINLKNHLNGRITENIITQIKLDLTKKTLCYICGPEQMINECSEVLKKNNVNSDQVFFELFRSNKENLTQTQNKDGELVAIIDSVEHTIAFSGNKTILEIILDKNIDAPYSCQGGVCSTCIAFVKKGSASMKSNQILTDDEIKEGLILTCQAVPTSSKLIIDYDDV